MHWLFWVMVALGVLGVLNLFLLIVMVFLEKKEATNDNRLADNLNLFPWDRLHILRAFGQWAELSHSPNAQKKGDL